MSGERGGSWGIVGGPKALGEPSDVWRRVKRVHCEGVSAEDEAHGAPEEPGLEELCVVDEGSGP